MKQEIQIGKVKLTCDEVDILKMYLNKDEFTEEQRTKEFPIAINKAINNGIADAVKDSEQFITKAQTAGSNFLGALEISISDFEQYSALIDGDPHKKTISYMLVNPMVYEINGVKYALNGIEPITKKGSIIDGRLYARLRAIKEAFPDAQPYEIDLETRKLKPLTYVNIVKLEHSTYNSFKKEIEDSVVSDNQELFDLSETVLNGTGNSIHQFNFEEEIEGIRRENKIIKVSKVDLLLYGKQIQKEIGCDIYILSKEGFDLKITPFAETLSNEKQSLNGKFRYDSKVEIYTEQFHFNLSTTT